MFLSVYLILPKSHMQTWFTDMTQKEVRFQVLKNDSKRAPSPNTWRRDRPFNQLFPASGISKRTKGYSWKRYHSVLKKHKRHQAITARQIRELKQFWIQRFSNMKLDQNNPPSKEEVPASEQRISDDEISPLFPSLALPVDDKRHGARPVVMFERSFIPQKGIRNSRESSPPTRSPCSSPEPDQDIPQPNQNIPETNGIIPAPNGNIPEPDQDIPGRVQNTPEPVRKTPEPDRDTPEP